MIKKSIYQALRRSVEVNQTVSSPYELISRWQANSVTVVQTYKSSCILLVPHKFLMKCTPSAQFDRFANYPCMW